MLSIYTFVFTVAFKARWGINTNGSKAEFALILFTGLILYSLISEILVSSPQLIANNANYVKKVVFPLEILTVVNVCSVVFQSVISFTVLLIAIIIFFRSSKLFSFIYSFNNFAINTTYIRYWLDYIFFRSLYP